VGVVAFVLWALPRDAHAYIDPGSGALLIQAVLSGLFGFIFIARKTLSRIASRLFGTKPAAPVADTEEPSRPAKTD
jgi:hypothetical protein